MARIVQIIEISQDDNAHAGRFLALREDGSIWMLDVGEKDGKPAYQIEEIPQA